MSSIRQRLLFWLFAMVIACVALAGGVIYRQARAEANQLFDYQLRQMAAALPSGAFASMLGEHADGTDDVVVQIWSRNGTPLYYSHPGARLATTAELGFSTERTSQGDFRVYTAIVGQNVVQVAQAMAVREQLAARTAWRTLWPVILILPLLGVLIWRVVGRELGPLGALARALDARAPGSLAPLAPRRRVQELAPLVDALNGLLERLNAALDRQKGFVAAAAHELRTPLAAVRIQAQLLERASDDDERRTALADLRGGIARATRLAEQLLLLARTDPAGGAVGRAEPVDLKALIEAQVAALATVAFERGVDLGIVEAAPARARGAADDFEILLGNLLDNAIKYTPAGGRIDVTLAAAPAASASMAAEAGAVLSIADTGPGIQADERERVFDRFYRGAGATGAAEGSGLGLAIVRQIAARHGIAIELSDARPVVGGIAAGTGAVTGAGESPGLAVTVRFPPLRDGAEGGAAAIQAGPGG
ncbi:ATP-binding protein [Chitinasiproducens palmae]|uniref:histidine kinase n=1 Tax=Chitinasiproducens palmae TaxID=1770053 RepID=A0A1H2PWB6_9BURK|nr:ATP-binding protein [Chitinasiproducens palmae]SDV51620.1 two-component system, OmpR family, sensor kinase [Chitinasiproducens palmae]